MYIASMPTSLCSSSKIYPCIKKCRMFQAILGNQTEKTEEQGSGKVVHR